MSWIVTSLNQIEYLAFECCLCKHRPEQQLLSRRPSTMSALSRYIYRNRTLEAAQGARGLGRFASDQSVKKDEHLNYSCANRPGRGASGLHHLQDLEIHAECEATRESRWAVPRGTEALAMGPSSSGQFIYIYIYILFMLKIFKINAVVLGSLAYNKNLLIK